MATSQLVDYSLRTSLLVSAALLAGAHIFQAMGYAPCELCLDQREAHWTGLAVAVAGVIASSVFRAPLAAAAAVGAAALIYALSAGLAFYHTGVEFGYWPGPASCSGGAAGGFAGVDLTEALQRGAKPPSCADPAWTLFGVSMAGYNFIISAGLFAFCFVAALTTTRRVRRQPLGDASLAE